MTSISDDLSFPPSLRPTLRWPRHRIVDCRRRMASTTANTQLLGSTRVSSRHTTARRSVAASACCSQSQRAGSLSAKLALGGRSAQALRTAAFLGSASPLSAARRGALSVFAGKKVLIVNTPSGAHGVLRHCSATLSQIQGT